MTIIIKNKETLLIDEFKFKCSVGKKGFTRNKKEGDLKTPAGIFELGKIYYRPDRIEKPLSKLQTTTIKKNMGWCDDPKSKDYNKLIKYPFNYKSEKLYRSNNIYDIILVLNFNMHPIKKNKGSAIFIHISNNKYSPTQGCIAIKKKELIKLIKFINKKTKIIIN